MTDKEKLQAIRLLALTYIGDKHSLVNEIIEIINVKDGKKNGKKHS